MLHASGLRKAYGPVTALDGSTSPSRRARSAA